MIQCLVSEKSVTHSNVGVSDFSGISRFSIGDTFNDVCILKRYEIECDESFQYKQVVKGLIQPDNL